MRKSEIEKLLHKAEIQNANGIDTSKALVAAAMAMMSDETIVSNELQKRNTYIRNEMGEISPFYLKMIEQFEFLLTRNFRSLSAAYQILSDNFTKDSFYALFDTATNLQYACAAFTEQLEKENQKRKLNIASIEIKRLEGGNRHGNFQKRN